MSIRLNYPVQLKQKQMIKSKLKRIVRLFLFLLFTFVDLMFSTFLFFVLLIDSKQPKHLKSTRQPIPVRNGREKMPVRNYSLSKMIANSHKFLFNVIFHCRQIDQKIFAIYVERQSVVRTIYPFIFKLCI